MSRILIALSLVLCCSCGVLVNQDKAVEAAEKQGYSEIMVVNKGIFFVSWRGCSKSDDAVITATAKNAKGEEVDILICAGWPFKAVTVRTE